MLLSIIYPAPLHMGGDEILLWRETVILILMVLK